MRNAIWKSVVGKLWMTIIGLVALVLIIVSLLLGRFVNTDLVNTQDQRESLERLAVKMTAQVSRNLGDVRYIELVNELLSAEQSHMIIIQSDFNALETGLTPDEIESFRAEELFSRLELSQVFEGRVLFTQVIPLKHSYLAVALPIAINSDHFNGAMIIYQLHRTLDYTVDYVRKLFIYAMIIGFLLTTFFAFFLSTKITQPLLQLKKAADSISQGDYQTNVVSTSSDEIGDLANTFNHMAQELNNTIEDLNHEKEHLSSVLSSMSDAVITFDAEGIAMLMNPQGEKILTEWSGLNWVNISQTWNVPEPLQSVFEAVLRGEMEQPAKIHVHDEFWSVVMAPLYSNEQIRGAVAVLRNVTEEYRLDKLRKDFVANVSHELRTPLSMLQGYSEALMDDIAASPEERGELVQVIHDESLRMGRLVHDLLDLARMEAGHLKLQYNEVDAAALMQRMHRKFSVLCKEQGIILVNMIDSEPMLLEAADEDRLEQVFTNLLDNAIRHTPGEKSIVIRAKLDVIEAKRFVRIEIEDEGIGIPSSDLPYIFERFYKADKARTRGTTSGTGLGLSIVKNIVDAHEGHIQARSKQGEGTTFSVLLPQHPSTQKG